MNVVLLQGPLGPFFADLADQMSALGMTVYRICFNKGDWHYGAADHVVNYMGHPDNWAAWFADFTSTHNIAAAVCYGDSRFYHRVARQVCAAQGVRFHACEEGYVRPGYITFEEGGNNANSPFAPAFLAGTLPEKMAPKPAEVRDVFKHQFWFATMYYTIKDWRLYGYRMYRHHRAGNWASEMMAWLRGGFRKNFVTRFKEQGLSARLVEKHGGRLFVVPLQVAVDTQMIYHSDYASVDDFITDVMQSFAQHAQGDAHLVIKHHPMDRGFNHYGYHIASLSRALGCIDRVTYGFDLDLALLLDNAAGCVTVNSTVASQALDVGVPTLTLGKSMVKAAGLTATLPLDAFWANPPEVDRNAVARFRREIVAHTQLAGSFYVERHLAATGMARRVHENMTKNYL